MQLPLPRHHPPPPLLLPTGPSPPPHPTATPLAVRWGNSPSRGPPGLGAGLAGEACPRGRRPWRRRCPGQRPAAAPKVAFGEGWAQLVSLETSLKRPPPAPEPDSLGSGGAPCPRLSRRLTPRGRLTGQRGDSDESDKAEKQRRQATTQDAEP
nr:vasodilator-stimulated phosphoprotein-like [Dasypus novemcinctus]